jgi:predicted DNA-binding transcriptional regulator AlpA
MDQDKLLTSDQAAEHLGLKNPKTLAVWRSTGRHALPFVKIGHMVRYRQSDLRSFISSRLSTPVEDSS